MALRLLYGTGTKLPGERERVHWNRLSLIHSLIVRLLRWCVTRPKAVLCDARPVGDFRGLLIARLRCEAITGLGMSGDCGWGCGCYCSYCPGQTYTFENSYIGMWLGLESESPTMADELGNISGTRYTRYIRYSISLGGP